MTITHNRFGQFGVGIVSGSLAEAPDVYGDRESGLWFSEATLVDIRNGTTMPGAKVATVASSTSIDQILGRAFRHSNATPDNTEANRRIDMIRFHCAPITGGTVEIRRPLDYKVNRLYVGWAAAIDPEDPAILDILFSIKNPASVKSFVLLHQGLRGFLVEAHQKIQEIFGEFVQEVRLRKYTNPEEDIEKLTIITKTSLDAEGSLDLLDRFYAEWWLGADEYHTDNLILQVESRGF